MLKDKELDKILIVLSTPPRQGGIETIFKELGADFNLYEDLVGFFSPEYSGGENIAEDAIQIIGKVFDKHKPDGATLLKFLPFLFAFLKAKDLLYASLQQAQNELSRKIQQRILNSPPGMMKISYPEKEQ